MDKTKRRTPLITIFRFYFVGARERLKKGAEFMRLYINWVSLFRANFRKAFEDQQRRLAGFQFPPSCQCRYHQGLTDDSLSHNEFVVNEERSHE